MKPYLTVETPANAEKMTDPATARSAHIYASALMNLGAQDPLRGAVTIGDVTDWVGDGSSSKLREAAKQVFFFLSCCNLTYRDYRREIALCARSWYAARSCTKVSSPGGKHSLFEFD